VSALLGIMAAEALGSAFVWGQLPSGLAWMGAGLCTLAAVVLHTGWRAARGERALAALDAFFAALTLAGVLAVLLGAIQAFAPGWTDGTWLAEPTIPGRAVGNLRQPNHLSTLLVWACCGAAWLGARKRLNAWSAAGLIAAFIFGVVLTASRTGMLGMVFLCLWGLLGRGLPRPVRAALVAAPALYGICWGGMWLLSHADKGVTFAAEARLHDKSDISSSRFKIWANVLDLIRANPMWGVGYGEFNVAWTLTPFPNRPVAFFDHTHNILLQWAVEFGIPAALLLTGLCGLAYFALLAGPFPASDESDHTVSAVGACAVVVAIAGLHSLLEYPLWYSYFLLPTAFAWGLGLGVHQTVPDRVPASEASSLGLRAAGALMAALSIWCTVDYLFAVDIYAPWGKAGSLEDRIALDKKMPWWGYQADYADVTIVEEDEPSRPPDAFKRTLHNLLDARLMMAYARSLAEHGEVDKARYVVERLKEFHNSLSDNFLAACNEPESPEEERPFQCEPPVGTYTWRDVLP
jgi:O-antigen ligase